MTARILDGRAVAHAITREVRDEAEGLRLAGGPTPALVVVRAGDDPASLQYAAQIERACRSVGFGYSVDSLPLSTDNVTLVEILRGYSAQPDVTGILLQTPLPKSLDPERAAAALDPTKDIDGINPLNAGRLFVGRGDFFAPATPLGGVELLKRSGIAVAGRRVVVVGRSPVVGRPLAMLFLHQNATVTICHSQTPDLGRVTRQAEILAVATGRPGLVTGDMVAPGAVVLDFGINAVDGRFVGDVDAASVASVAGALTPVPGGTGPMTIAMLLSNLLKAARRVHP